MKLAYTPEYLTIETSSYLLQLAPVPHNSFLRDRHSGRLFAFAAGGDCDPTGRSDETIDASAWEVVEKTPSYILLANEVVSPCWESKKFLIRLEKDRMEFWHEINGKGSLQEVRFFRVCHHGNEFGFCGDVDEVFTVAPNFHEQRYYHTSQSVIHCYGTDFSLIAGCMALASVPHVLALHDRNDAWYTVFGAFARPGHYDWDEFRWNPASKHAPTAYIGDAVLGGGFALCYFGKKTVDGQWESPRLCVTFADGENQVLTSALAQAYDREYMPRPAGKKQFPDWWKEPIYCTWHDQAAIADGDKVDFNTPGETPVGELCTQANTDRWLDLLCKNNCTPGTVILDDKWQRTLCSGEPDTAKWPDLRKWIDECHRKGIRVFLWGMAWYKDGIPENEMITRDGKPVCGDITHPAFETRVREMVRKMFSDAPDCLNADGIKIDGFLGLPTGAGLKNYGNIWGLELQKRFLEIFHGEAKKHKTEVCISVYTANPYLDAYSDMIRLGDMWTSRISPRQAMISRAAAIRIMHPGTLIDTDGQFYYSGDPDYISLLDTQAGLGIPTIYVAEKLRHGHFYLQPVLKDLSAGDYRHIAEVFEKYRKENKLER